MQRFFLVASVVSVLDGELENVFRYILLHFGPKIKSCTAYNNNRKLAKYRPLYNSLRTNYTSIKFVNLSMSALCIFGTSSDSLLLRTFFLKLHFHIYKLNIQIQISLMLGNLHSAGLSTDISTHQANKTKKKKEKNKGRETVSMTEGPG